MAGTNSACVQAGLGMHGLRHISEQKSSRSGPSVTHSNVKEDKKNIVSLCMLSGL